MKQKKGIYYIVIAYAILLFGLNAQAQGHKPDELVSYSFKAPTTVTKGEVFEINTIFNIQPGWYVYAPLSFNINQGKIVTKVTFRLPDGVEFVGSMVLPEGQTTYTGNNVTLTQKFKIIKAFPDGKVVIPANVVYQTCNEYICYPPVKESKLITIKIND
jgi:hypothetical protein